MNAFIGSMAILEINAIMETARNCTWLLLNYPEPKRASEIPELLRKMQEEISALRELAGAHIPVYNFKGNQWK